MGFLWESIPEQGSIEHNKYKKLFKETTTKHFLYAPEGRWEKYCSENSDIIWEAFDDETKEFMKNVISAGNFITMPVYVNPCRCKQFGGDDTLDTLLWKLYCCFELRKQDGVRLREYLTKAFRGKNEEAARENVLLWMEIFNNSWEEFVEYNYLTDAVESNGDRYGKPIDLRTGKPIDEEIGAEYNPLPEDIGKCRTILKNYNNLVCKRTNDIYDKLLRNVTL